MPRDCAKRRLPGTVLLEEQCQRRNRLIPQTEIRLRQIDGNGLGIADFGGCVLGASKVAPADQQWDIREMLAQVMRGLAADKAGAANEKNGIV